MVAVRVFTFFTTSSSLENMAVMLVARLICITFYEVKGLRLIVVISVEFLGPNNVFAEGEMMRNKYCLGL